jgi:hypothetical protein
MGLAFFFFFFFFEAIDDTALTNLKKDGPLATRINSAVPFVYENVGKAEDSSWGATGCQERD